MNFGKKQKKSNSKEHFRIKRRNYFFVCYAKQGSKRDVCWTIQDEQYQF